MSFNSMVQKIFGQDNKKFTQSILSAGVPRSGTTWVCQILKCIFIDVRKTHLFEKTARYPVLIVRDFRDVYVSMKRTNTQKLHGPNEDLVNYINLCCTHINRYKIFYGNKLLILRYEDCFMNEKVTIETIAKHFSIAIDDKRINEINKKTNIYANLERQKILCNFLFYDEETQIHGMHIKSGMSGQWEDIENAAERDYICRKLKINLSKWCYI